MFRHPPDRHVNSLMTGAVLVGKKATDPNWLRCWSMRRETIARLPRRCIGGNQISAARTKDEIASIKRRAVP